MDYHFRYILANNFVVKPVRLETITNASMLMERKELATLRAKASFISQFVVVSQRFRFCNSRIKKIEIQKITNKNSHDIALAWPIWKN